MLLLPQQLASLWQSRVPTGLAEMRLPSSGQMAGCTGSMPGRSPKSHSIEKVKELGYDEIPAHGWIPVTVPGAPGDGGLIRTVSADSR